MVFLCYPYIFIYKSALDGGSGKYHGRHLLFRENFLVKSVYISVGAQVNVFKCLSQGGF